MEPLNWFFSICTVSQVEQMILECSESINCHNEKVKSQNTGHHAKEYVSSSLSLFKNCISNLGCKKEISILSMQKILDKIEDKREKPDNIRRHFYEKEIQSMLEEVKHDYQYTLIFRILIEIGLRVGALVKLKTSDLVNLDSTVKREAKVIEKGCTIRSFPVSENIERDLKKYLEQSKPTIWLFPSIRDNTKHISVSAIQDKIKVLSEKLGISGMHMHPHAFRHTLVNKLMSTGNDMTKISRYIGHSSSHTTEKYYWTSTITEVASSMNIPWLSSISIDKISRPVKKEEVVEDNEYEDERTNVITHILLTCIAMFTQEQKTELKKKIPNIDVIIDNLHETTTTTSSHY
jgi:site-specific recombinase XerC